MANKTIVGLFDEASDAQAVVQELVQAGITRDHISLITNRGEVTNIDEVPDDGANDVLTGAGIGAVLGGVGGLLVGLAVLPIPGLGPVIAAGPIATTLAGMGIGAAAGGLVGALTNIGVPEEHAHHYAEGVRRGATLVSVEADPVNAGLVTGIMARYHAFDVNERAAMWRKTGWTGYDASAPAFSADEAARERMRYRNLDIDKGQVTIPVVEEQVAVGKREVRGGGVRVSNRVVERPVEEQLTLRDERVNVERHAVDRPATAADGAFREGTLEFKETREEPVVSKTARVVEEVVVNKDVKERTQTVKETARRNEVDVQPTRTSETPAQQSRTSQTPRR